MEESIPKDLLEEMKTAESSVLQVIENLRKLYLENTQDALDWIDRINKMSVIF